MSSALSRYLSLLTLTFALLFFAAPTAYAQDSIQTQADAFGPVNPGTLDFTLGVGGFFYNTVEPGADIGIFAIDDVGAFSVGGYLEAGYCLVGCFLFNSLMNWATDGQADLKLRAFHINPMLRTLFHVNALAKAVDMRALDVYGGLLLGPSFYNVTLSVLNEMAQSRQITFLAGPVIGLRFTFGDGRGLFVFGEGRYLAEFGSTNFQLRTSDGQVYSDNGVVRRGGRRIKLGIGFRF